MLKQLAVTTPFVGCFVAQGVRVVIVAIWGAV